jgi:glutamine amidotransferase
LSFYGGLRPQRVSPAGATVGLVDYGMGNRRSVEKALEHVGARVTVSADPDVLAGTDALVVPGVGSFPRAMERLASLGLDGFLIEAAAEGKPILGICLGMQLFFERSSENGGAEGLGVVPGEVVELQAGDLKLPHIGWSTVHWTGESPLLEGVHRDVAYYHVHSYTCVPAQPEDDVLGFAEYGGRFTTAVTHGSFSGVQFHPEKSSLDGLALLANFVSSCVVA